LLNNILHLSFVTGAVFLVLFNPQTVKTVPVTYLTAIPSVVDPDPVGSENEQDPEKIIPDPGSSGFEMNFK
jgi:hypothetical protein